MQGLVERMSCDQEGPPKSDAEAFTPPRARSNSAYTSISTHYNKIAGSFFSEEALTCCSLKYKAFP